MQFINKSNNTVYLTDIDRHVEYREGSIEEISVDDILKSESFQQMVVLGCFDIVSCGEHRIERNLLRLCKQMANLRQKQQQIENLLPDSKKPVSTDRDVLIKGHFLEGGGYAKYNRNLALGLTTLGVKVKIDVVGNKNQLTEQELRKIMALKGTASRNTIRIDSMIPSFSNVSAGRNTVLYTTIESYSVPKQFIDIANSYREIWVTSDFCKDRLIDAGLKQPIYVMPCSVDKNEYVTEGDKYQFRPELNPFVFLSVFGWSYRKGYDTLLRAYLNAFTGDDPVTLLIVSKVNMDSGRSDVIKSEIDKYIKEYGGSNPPHIARCSKAIPESQMPSLYRACNAFALFSRGEGFGLPYCEASLCGLPVIGTNCSGQSMFLNPDNSYLLEIDSLVKVVPGTMHVHYWDNQEFPSLKSQKTVNEASRLMRQVYDNYDQAKEKNEKLRKFVMSNYSIGKVVLQVKRRLDEIWSNI